MKTRHTMKLPADGFSALYQSGAISGARFARAIEAAEDLLILSVPVALGMFLGSLVPLPAFL